MEREDHTSLKLTLVSRGVSWLMRHVARHFGAAQGRTEAEKAAFKKALENMDLFYAHQRCTTFLMVRSGDGTPVGIFVGLEDGIIVGTPVGVCQTHLLDQRLVTI